MSKSSAGQSIVLFFTRGVSLETWERNGSLERELALWKALRPHLGGVTLVTYGGKRDLEIAKGLGDFRVIANRLGLPQRVYTRALQSLYPRLCPEGAIVRSNQVLGAEVALAAARRRGRPFIARCGYLHSNIAAWNQGEDSERAKYAFDLEKKIFRDADRVVVTTPEMHRTVIERYQAVPERVRVIPNFVQVDRFKPAESPVPSRKLCFVGRMHREKNLENLLEATRGLDLELLMIGGGELREPLERRSREENLPVRFLGNVPNANLPGILQEAAAFVFPSLWEHHPKALLEAMACGLPVIGTRVAGIQELIEHRQTGYLCGTSAEELRAAIQAVLNDPELRIALGRNARDSIVRNFSLERVIELELALLEEMAR